MIMGELIPLLAIICTIGLPLIVGLLLGLRWMNNRSQERMGLINQGIIPPDSPRRKATPNRLVALRNGILFISIGIGVIVGFLSSEYLVIGIGNKFWITGASIVFFMGVGYLVYFLVAQKIPQSIQREDIDFE